MKEIELPSGNFLMFLELPATETTEEVHEYRVGLEWNTAERVPGSHEIMHRHGLIEPMNEAMRRWVERGKNVHLAIEQYWDGTYDEEGPWAKSEQGEWLECYKRFLVKHPEFASPLTVERPAGSEEYWAATIPDQTHEGFRLLQVKSGHVNAKVHAPQLAIEGLLAFPSASGFERWALYLDPKLYRETDGFKLIEYVDDESMGMVTDWFAASRSTRTYMTTRRKPTKAIKETTKVC